MHALSTFEASFLQWQLFRAKRLFIWNRKNSVVEKPVSLGTQRNLNFDKLIGLVVAL